MDYARFMHCHGLRLRRHFQTTLLGVALGCVTPGWVTGEPILFSGRTGPAAPQDFDRREPLLPAEARGLNRANQAMDPVLAPAQSVTPTTGLTRRQLDAQEQKRNWIFQSSETILKQSTEREADKQDDGEPSKSAVERFVDGPDRKSDSADPNRNGDASNRSARDRKDNSGNSTRTPRVDAAKNSTGLEVRGTGSTRDPNGANLFGGGDAHGSSFSRAMTESRDRQRERDASLDAFKRTLNNPWSQPAASGGEPSRFVGSAGPTGAGLPAPSFDRRGPGGSLGQPGRPAMDLGPRGGVGEFDPKNPLNYGAPETVLRNNEPPRTAPKPVVLEVPKRKF